MAFFENDSGRILIDKPAGITSFGVVARIRRVLKNEFGKKIKVGHTGTLDPFATGLLVLLYGKETKNAMSLTKLDKVYEAEFTLGQISSTGDPEGEISKKKLKLTFWAKLNKHRQLLVRLKLMVSALTI